MSDSLWTHFLKDHGAVFASDGATVLHFGNAVEELRVAETDAVVCPLPNWIRIRATGNDRAKFLHNFCTNNVVNLQVGQSCEAFFTDVRARVLAHGFVVAGSGFHEIQMLPGDEAALVQHLNRYIITEDVVIKGAVEHATVAIVGATSDEIVSAMSLLTPSVDSVKFRTEWASLPLTFVSVPVAEALGVWDAVSSARTVPAGQNVVEHLRIREGFPRVGVDITHEHLAPEANRNAQAISYTKGCYLGQEPIARLDAMGHVNRQLFRGVAKRIGGVPDSSLPLVTSVSSVGEDAFLVLLPLAVREAAARKPIAARLGKAEQVEVTLGDI